LPTATVPDFARVPAASADGFFAAGFRAVFAAVSAFELAAVFAVPARFEAVLVVRLDTAFALVFAVMASMFLLIAAPAA